MYKVPTRLQTVSLWIEAHLANQNCEDPSVVHLVLGLVPGSISHTVTFGKKSQLKVDF
jgi:hypothetical protein